MLVEVGYVGGRTGVRSLEEGLAVARAGNRVRAPASRRRGRLWRPDARGATGEPAGLEAYLESIAQTAHRLNAAGLLRKAGCHWSVPVGSSYFDRVVAHLGPGSFGFPVQTVLRSGCYLTDDHGIYRRTSPFDGRGSPSGPRLRLVFELLASVLSRPEPTLAIVGFGRRDVPYR